MKERPILFSAPMVRAILEGRKTQTRRTIKIQPADVGAVKFTCGCLKVGNFYFTSNSGKIGIFEPNHIKCPYGQKGTKIWVRETHFLSCDKNAPDLERGQNMHYKASANQADLDWFKEEGWKWTPSIFMPKWFTRIWLEITDVRVERLQDISEEDSIAEGSQIPCDQLPKSCQQATMTERTQFSRIWDSINGKKHPWSSNPWVWVIEFKKVKP